LEKALTQDIQEFFDSRYGEMLVSDEVSQDFKEADEQSKKLSEKLKQLLNEEGKEILQNLTIQHGIKAIEAAATGYQKGFAEGVKFILYLSIK
jgi:hypothetical protein